ncbi:hypothetical protein C1T17_16520 [Sphingobium sp. SCG-1]|nr:hypothetical protein C1T17_16520 [Sphingobium sp. SCG-1]
MYGDGGDDTISVTDVIYVDSGSGDDIVSVRAGNQIFTGQGNDRLDVYGSVWTEQYFIDMGEGNDTADLNDAGFFYFYFGPDGGNDTIIFNPNNTGSIGAYIETQQTYIGADIYIKDETGELLDSDPDGSMWEVEVNIKLNFDNGSTLVKNVDALVSTFASSSISDLSIRSAFINQIEVSNVFPDFYDDPTVTWHII